METLTATQAKMVSEYFGAQAAEDSPFVEHDSRPDMWTESYKHEWMTRLQLNLKLEREVTEHDWYAAVVNMIDAQSFDRDPAGYLNERGYTEKDTDYMHGVLEDLVSWAIDQVHANAKVDW